MTKIIKCAFCSGAGIDPYALLSSISTCQVCEGTGLVEVNEPSITCVFCAGSGKNPLGAKVTCIVCRGKGNNYCESDTICDRCNGTGRWDDGLPCTRCKGIGYI